MAETAPAPNNKSVNFGGKVEREMSTTKRMNAEDQPVDGVATPAKKLSPRLRKTAKKAMRRGMISEKAAKRHLGGV